MTSKAKYRPDIQKRIDDRLSYMTDKHRKVMSTRMDVRFPKEGYSHDGSNDEISEFTKRLKEPYTEKGNEMQFVWARERNTSENVHYHFNILLNGSMTQDPYSLFQKATKTWNTILGGEYDGLIDYGRHEYKGRKPPPSVMIEKPSSTARGEELERQQKAFDEAKEKARKRAEYLAKTYSKGDAPCRVREFGCSQLPKKPK